MRYYKELLIAIAIFSSTTTSLYAITLTPGNTGEFNGLYNNGEIYINPGNFGGTESLEYSIPSTGYYGLTYDGTSFYGLFENGNIYQNPGDFGGTQMLVGNIGLVSRSRGASGYRGLAYDGVSFYGLSENGNIYINPGNFGGTQALVYSIPSTGYYGLTYDGTSFYGLFENGNIYQNPGDFGGSQVLVGSIGRIDLGFGSVGFRGLEFIKSTTIIPSVPLPSAVWLFGSGLIGLMGFTRRKKS